MVFPTLGVVSSEPEPLVLLPSSSSILPDWTIASVLSILMNKGPKIGRQAQMIDAQGSIDDQISI